MIYYIYAKYSKDDRLKNFSDFKHIVDKISKFNKGVLIENGCHTIDNVFDNLSIINGSNNYFDLSAYDEGLKYLIDNNNLKESDLVIFANDTLLLKHKFSKLTRIYIVWKIKSLLNSCESFAFGDIDRSKIVKYNLWISTYFFVTTFKGISFFKNFVIKDYLYKKMIVEVESPNIKWGRYFNSDFQIEISSWLNPDAENNYFKYNNRKIDSKFFRIKLHNVIAERFISDTLIRNNVKIYSIRPNFFFKILRKFEEFKCKELI